MAVKLEIFTNYKNLRAMEVKDLSCLLIFEA
jgi:hypothetical protein